MKKRILTFCLTFVMALIGVLTLSACGTAHICDEKISYIGEQNKAYEVKTCECGKRSQNELVEGSYVIATPSTAQSVLDQNINGKMVIFDAGDYGILEVRASYDTATIYSIANGGSEWGTEEISKDQLSSSVNGYNYFRTIENVSFIGTENAKFEKPFVMETSSIAYYQPNHLYDAVRQMDYSGNQTLRSYNHLTIKNVTLKNMNFSGSEARIIGEINLNSGSIDGLTIDGCSFVGSTDSMKNNAARIGVNKGNLTNVSVKNLTFINNNVSNYYKAFDFLGFENAIVKNNTVSNCKHNAFGFYSYHENDVDDDHIVYISGNIVIENNIISNGEDRAVKIYEMKNGTITVKNNKITDYSDGEDVLQFKLISNTSLVATGNTYNGKNLQEQNTNSFETIAITIPE